MMKLSLTLLSLVCVSTGCMGGAEAQEKSRKPAVSGAFFCQAMDMAVGFTGQVASGLQENLDKSCNPNLPYSLVGDVNNLILCCVAK
jgi:hypothetical protein